MVEFLDYGNFEEVLHSDCIPIVPDDQQLNSNFTTYSDNQQISGIDHYMPCYVQKSAVFSNVSGNMEFRRGKNRPFVKNPHAKPVYGSNRGYET